MLHSPFINSLRFSWRHEHLLETRLGVQRQWPRHHRWSSVEASGTDA
jgi:hypothetical protein